MNKRHLKVTKDGHEKMKARIEVKFISNYSTFMAIYFVAKIVWHKQWNKTISELSSGRDSNSKR